MRCKLSFFLSLFFIALIPLCSFAEQCGYINESNELVVVARRSEIPQRFLTQSKCVAQTQVMAKPSDIDLGNTLRTVTIPSALGEVHLRWPRSVEKLFGRTPERAVGEAARVVAKTIARNGFPTGIRFDQPWEIVFMDESLPEHQIPKHLISNCHPGWMTPPSNIYIVGQRVAAGCGGGKQVKSVADAELLKVLLHEMGHAVEAQLLGPMFSKDRMRAEGFATWFEYESSKNTSLLNAKDTRKELFDRARPLVSRGSGFNFQGTSEDYARASLYFFSIAETKSIPRLMDVYSDMKSQQIGLMPAVNKELGIRPEVMELNIKKLVEKE